MAWLASGVTVEAVPVRPRYENDLPFAADSATTDQDGHYELRNLDGGDYYLGISLSRPPTLQTYTRWFFPGWKIHPPRESCMCPTDPKPCDST